MASAWRDQLSPGSYKGVPFFIDSHEFSGGRRIVDHLFPYREVPFTEDLGLQQRVFSIELYIVGDDYFEARDNLIAAFEKEGAGILVHPYLGTKTVEAAEFSMRESRKDGGIVNFSVTFHETGRKASPDLDVDLTDLLEDADTEVDASLEEDFGGFDVSNFSLPNLDAVVAIVDKGSDAILKASSLIPGTDFGISELAYSIRILKANTRDLIRKPGKLVRYVLDSTALLAATLTTDGFIPNNATAGINQSANALRDTILAGIKKRSSLLPIIAVGAVFPLVDETTPSQVRINVNQRLFKNLLVGSAISKLAIISSQTTYATYDDAIVQQEFIVDEIEKILQDPLTTDRTFSAFQNLLTLVVKSIPGQLTQASRLSYVNINTSVPSIVLAYDLYENLNLEEDIVLRNKVKHPGFILPPKVQVIAGD